MSADPKPPTPRGLRLPKAPSPEPAGITGSVSRSAMPVPAMPASSTPVPAAAEAEASAEVKVAVAETTEPVQIRRERGRNLFLDYWRMVGGGSLAISLLVHAVLIAVFVAIVTVTVQEPKVDFLPGGGSKRGQEATRELTHQVQQKKRRAMNKTTPMRKVVSTGPVEGIALPDVPVDAVDVPELAIPMGGMSTGAGFGNMGAGGGFGAGRSIGGRMGFTSLPATMQSRCNSVERLQKLKENGGTPGCEKAVSNALEYLKTQQNADGSWGISYRGAMTGFALLCYFGRCETPDSTFYGENVLKGILYLIELSKQNNGMMADSKGGNAGVYEHGIATYALGEMYALARLGSKSLPGMREAFEKGIQIIIKNQLPTGGWGYAVTGGYRDSGRSDPSVTGWHYQALKAAKLSGIQFSGLHASIERTTRYLASIQTKDGGFGGANREEGAYTQWTMTGVAVLGLQTLGQGKGPEIRKGVKWAYDFYQQERPVWRDANFYVWYYVAQTFFQNGGPEWKFWNDTALPEILANQNKDGSWDTPTNHHGANSGGNKIYPTALCTLMLEVYYRYLKVGDREEGSIFDRGR